MIQYTAGFAFNGSNVLTIKKTKPTWQAGKLNGVGGKVELFDADFYTAQAREFFEETGIVTSPGDWTLFDVERFDGSQINWFFADEVDIESARQLTEESLEVWSVSDLCSDIFRQAPKSLYNVPYLCLKAYTFARNPSASIPNM